MKTEGTITKILGWIITVLLPPILLMMSIRLMISPTFARVEYQMPQFPDDPFGFTFEDRLRWSEPAIEYLVNVEDITFLSKLEFDNGERVFNDRELSHMQDVKAVVTGMRVALAVCMVVLLGVTFFAVRKGSKTAVLSFYRRGAWALLGLIFAVLLFVALSFNNLFTWFHHVFFTSGTWQFFTSDTLIRLFPMRFWRDAFIFVGVLSMILSGLPLLLGRGCKTKKVV
jgi:integral membrane protein (TIGR01906 family)